MSNRLALYASKKEIEDYFQFETKRESIFDPHYNIAPAQHIAIIHSKDGNPDILRARWGIDDEMKTTSKYELDLEEALEKLGSKNFMRCIIPISGYYKWKESGKRKENPFFIRMLDEPLMALAAVCKTEPSDEGADFISCALIYTEANALVQPLHPYMPLQLNRKLAQKWLDQDENPVTIANDAQKLFLLTDMTVLRVSKKVNDLSENSPKLIQPLPK